MTLFLGMALGIVGLLSNPEVGKNPAYIMIVLITTGLFCLAIHFVEELTRIRKVQSYFIREKIKQQQGKLSQNDLLPWERSINIKKEIEQLEELL